MQFKKVAITGGAGYLGHSARVDAGKLGGESPDIDALGTITPSSVIPIPAALPLLLSGLVGLGLIGWRRRKAA